MAATSLAARKVTARWRWQQQTKQQMKQQQKKPNWLSRAKPWVVLSAGRKIPATTNTLPDDGD